MGRLADIAEKLGCCVGDIFWLHDAATYERAATIADILRTLPLEGQDALVELVANAAGVMRRA